MTLSDGFAERAGDQLRSYQDRALDGTGRIDVAALVEGAQHTRHVRARRAQALTGGGLVLSVALVFGWASQNPEVSGESLISSYAVNGAEPTTELNRQVLASADGTKVRFDGASLELDKDAALKVEELFEQGAAIRLDSGRVTCNVNRKSPGNWTLRAGDYVLRVVGTAFDVRWEPESGDFELNVARGSVEVTGPQVEGVREVTAGGSLIIKGGVQATEIHSAMLSPDDLEDEVPEADEGAAPSDVSAAGSWKVLAKQGKYKESMAKIEARGFDQVVRTLSVGELLKLADVARMAGQSGRASTLLHQIRSRAPGTGAAATAAYSLGTTAFDQRGNFSSAHRWFSTYLAEAPGGPLAREALGRSMEAQHRAGMKAGARAAAKRYLALYPSGLHAGLAKRLVGSAP